MVLNRQDLVGACGLDPFFCFFGLFSLWLVGRCGVCRDRNSWVRSEMPTKEDYPSEDPAVQVAVLTWWYSCCCVCFNDKSHNINRLLSSLDRLSAANFKIAIFIQTKLRGLEVVAMCEHNH